MSVISSQSVVEYKRSRLKTKEERESEKTPYHDPSSQEKCMTEKKYQDRSVLDKLGIQPGYAVAFANAVRELDPDLPQRILERTGRPEATEDEALDLVVAVIDEKTDAVALLKKWRQHLVPNGGIWLLTAKRGQPGYVDQRELIEASQQAEVVDNKICAVSSTVSAMRFVIRKKDRRA